MDAVLCVKNYSNFKREVFEAQRLTCETAV